MPDGTILLLRRFAIPAKKHARIGVLFLPDPFGNVSQQNVLFSCAQRLPDKTLTAYILQPRGTGGSEGFWSLSSHRADVLDWMGALRKTHKKLIVIAEGVSANILLEMEENSHYRKEKRALLPDAMILFEPVENGALLAPATGIFRHIASFSPHFSAKARTRKGSAVGTVHIGHARILARESHAVLGELDALHLSSVRLQTHTFLYLSKLHDSIAKLFFGNVQISRSLNASTSGEHLTVAQTLLCAQEINARIRDLASRESPIRFYLH